MRDCHSGTLAVNVRLTVGGEDKFFFFCWTFPKKKEIHHLCDVYIYIN